MKLMSLDQLQTLAQQATLKKLQQLEREGFSLSEETKKIIALEVHFDGNKRIFELVKSSDVPENSLVLISIVGDLATGRVEAIKVQDDFFSCEKQW
jgi:hypothetical protein